AAVTTLVIVPAGCDGGTRTVTTALTLWPGSTSPNVQAVPSHGASGVGSIDTRAVPSGRVSSSDTSRAVDGPSLVTVTLKTAWSPAGAVSRAAVWVAARSADWVGGVSVTAVSSAGSGSLEVDVNVAVLTSDAVVALGSMRPTTLSTTVSKGSIVPSV